MLVVGGNTCLHTARNRELLKNQQRISRYSWVNIWECIVLSVLCHQLFIWWCRSWVAEVNSEWLILFGRVGEGKVIQDPIRLMSMIPYLIPFDCLLNPQLFLQEEIIYPPYGDPKHYMQPTLHHYNSQHSGYSVRYYPILHYYPLFNRNLHILVCK